MKAAVLHIPGTTPVYQDFPDPVPAEGEQLLLVKASSIKNIDRMRALGTHYDQYPKYPVVTGLDGVGWLKDGKRVYAGSQKGMMAEKAVVRTEWVVPVPDSLDDVTASALPNPAVSAWLSLESEKKLTADDTVLILGATGTTGRLAVQLARLLGAGRIIAMGRNKTILESLVEPGADKIICLQDSSSQINTSIKEEMKRQPISRVLDYLWGEPAETVLDALSGHSLHASAYPIKYIQVGEMAGSQIRLNASTLRSTAIEIIGQGGGSISAEILKRIPVEIIPRIFDLAANGKLVIDVVATPLREVAAVWNNALPGKRTVLIP